MIFGVDTSYANGMPNWPQALRDPRVQFVISRVSYGSNPADDDGPAFEAAHDACKAVSRPFLPYFFWIAAQDPKTQSEHFLAAANGRYGTLSPVIDVEEGSGVEGWGDSVEERIDNLGISLLTVEHKLGQPIIYTDPNTWEAYFGGTAAFSGHRFWIAHYTGVPGHYYKPQGVKDVVLHQFSNGRGLAPIPGLSLPDNNVDRDVLLAPDFRALEPR